MAAPAKYFIKNISNKYDVNLSDIGIRIRIGQTVDLLGKGVKWENIERSRRNGSIALRLKKGMITEVDGVTVARPPSRAEVIREAILVKFPDRVNSSIIIDIGNIAENIEQLSISEDDELLKQLELDSADYERSLIADDED